MTSLYDDLSKKLEEDPLTDQARRRALRLTLLLFNARDALRELWDAAESQVTEAKRKGHPPPERLAAAVDKLRPIFGERRKPVSDGHPETRLGVKP